MNHLKFRVCLADMALKQFQGPGTYMACIELRLNAVAFGLTGGNTDQAISE